MNEDTLGRRGRIAILIEGPGSSAVRKCEIKSQTNAPRACPWLTLSCAGTFPLVRSHHRARCGYGEMRLLAQTEFGSIVNRPMCTKVMLEIVVHEGPIERCIETDKYRFASLSV